MIKSEDRDVAAWKKAKGRKERARKFKLVSQKREKKLQMAAEIKRTPLLFAKADTGIVPSDETLIGEVGIRHMFKPAEAKKLIAWFRVCKPYDWNTDDPESNARYFADSKNSVTWTCDGRCDTPLGEFKCYGTYDEDKDYMVQCDACDELMRTNRNFYYAVRPMTLGGLTIKRLPIPVRFAKRVSL